ncbi:hypothetical protein BH20VER3_BH20VER3_21000 [soil metagenome]
MFSLGDKRHHIVTFNIQRAVELFAAVQFFGIGLSHAIQPMAWVEFFALLRSKGRAGVFVEGFLCLGLGAFIVAFHPFWSGLPILTVVGALLVLLVLKGLLRFTAPQIVLRIYGHVTPERAWTFQVAGLFSLALGVLFGYISFAL